MFSIYKCKFLNVKFIVSCAQASNCINNKLSVAFEREQNWENHLWYYVKTVCYRFNYIYIYIIIADCTYVYVCVACSRFI